MKTNHPFPVVCLPRRAVFGLLAHLLWISIVSCVPLSARPLHGVGQFGDKEIQYRVTYRPDNSPRKIQVAMRFAVPRGASRVKLQMPVWSPGDYHIQNHAKYVQEFTAHQIETGDKTGAALTVSHPDQNTWEVDTKGLEQVEVRYSLPETPPGFFSENIELQTYHAFLNGPAVFMYLAGGKETPARVLFDLPESWTPEMPLPADSAATPAARVFRAPDYDTLADSPLILAAGRALGIREFEVAGVPHRALFLRNPKRIARYDDYAAVMRRIVLAETTIMGGFPYKQYDFLIDVDGRGGGLEHLNSTRMAFDSGSPATSKASFIAHEYFHLWNVKRMRPRVLGPFDYINPPRTRNLWFAEGVTNYYAIIACRRAGLYSEEEFYSHWRDSIQQMQRNPARLRVSADDSSLKVWEAGNSSGYGGLSYYHKGELIGFCLDLKIRQVTAGKKSLDDVMRELFHRTNPPNSGYEEDEIRDMVNQVAGQNLSDFYDLLARSTKEMPFEECLRYVGLDSELRPLPDAKPEQIALRKSWSERNARIPER